MNFMKGVLHLQISSYTSMLCWIISTIKNKLSIIFFFNDCGVKIAVPQLNFTVKSVLIAIVRNV